MNEPRGEREGWPGGTGGALGRPESSEELGLRDRAGAPLSVAIAWLDAEVGSPQV